MEETTVDDAGESDDTWSGGDRPAVEPAPPVRSRRGRKPRRRTAEEGGLGSLLLPLDICTEVFDGAVFLRLDGKLESDTLVTLRDFAFTAIGKRPREVCIDFRKIGLPLERQVLETILTIGRVARMVQVGFSVMLPPQLDRSWRNAGLSRLIPIQVDSQIPACPLKPDTGAGVSINGVS